MNCLECSTSTVDTRDGYCQTCRPDKWEGEWNPTAGSKGKTNGHAEPKPQRKLRVNGHAKSNKDRPCPKCGGAVRGAFDTQCADCMKKDADKQLAALGGTVLASGKRPDGEMLQLNILP